jgi:hypothetical protein
VLGVSSGIVISGLEEDRCLAGFVWKTGYSLSEDTSPTKSRSAKNSDLTIQPERAEYAKKGNFLFYP